MTIPSRALDRETVLATLRAYARDDVPTHGGRTFAYVYDAGTPDVDETAREAAGMFLWHNGLDPTAFPSLLRLENEIVGMLAGHLGGGPGTAAPEACGTVTSGGTESCLLAVKSARDRRPRLDGPEMVLPATAHPAFHKAAHLFGVRPVVTPIDPESLRADAEAMASAITERTVLVVASAPSYAHGVVDPVREIASAASARGVLCHVDACVGGFVLPYLRRLGRGVPDFDLSVPGVTSIAADLHKYAYTPKGASALLYHDPALRAHQMWGYAAWPGYTVVNATLQGTKSGAPLAAAWATLRGHGDDGYLELARRAWEASRRLRAGIADLSGLRVLGDPDMTLLALAGERGVDVYALADLMRERGWYLQPQPARLGLSPTLHLTVGAATLPLVDDLLGELALAVEEARATPGQDVSELARMLRETDPTALTPRMVRDLLARLTRDGDGPDGAGAAPSGPPTRMADVNRLLDALPSQTVSALFVAVLNALYEPTSPTEDSSRRA
ncbi:MAG: pyridoxal phosphate-dependent decarboxylase family protein [Streptosporangiaceae bacterium]